MNRILSFIDCIDKALARLIKPIVVVLSLLIAFTLTYGIFTRAVLDEPVFGLEELVLMGAMWLYMLGAVLASRDRSHLTADFVEVLTHNPKVVTFVHLLATTISLFMAIMFAIWSYDLLQWGVKKGQTTPVFQLPWYFSQGSLFVASVLFIFYLIRDFINDLIRFQSPEKAH